jgi:glyoxylase-like metal-dependent hydrolase (beta-lactamase superfamily II)
MAKEVAPGVYEITTQFKVANAFLIVEDKLTLIDTGLKGSQSRVEKLLKELGRSPAELTQIIITHCHVDHTGSLAALKDLTGAKIAVHRADAPYLSRELPYPKPKTKLVGLVVSAMMLPMFNCPVLTADTLLDDGSEVGALGGLKVIHTPGHTPGHICLYSPARRILFAGDLIGARGGKLRVSSKTYSTDLDQARASLQRLRGLQVDTLCMGHADAITVEAESKLRELLDESPA